MSIGQASAAEGYGLNGYGMGPYGQPTDTPSVVVSTQGVTDIESDTVTLHGSLDDSGDASSIDCYFEYREEGTRNWHTMTSQTLTSPGSFSETLSGLASATQYEYRAVAATDETSTGTVLSFTTDSQTNTAPTIDSYVVTEAGSPNPHAEITAEWTVSDPDGDLTQATVRVADQSGSIVDSSRTSLSGSSGSDSDQFTIKHAKGATFDVTLTVTDSTGEISTQRRTVSE